MYLYELLVQNFTNTTFAFPKTEEELIKYYGSENIARLVPLCLSNEFKKYLIELALKCEKSDKNIPICQRLKTDRDFVSGEKIFIVDGNESRRNEKLIIQCEGIINSVSNVQISYNPVVGGKVSRYLSFIKTNSLQVVKECDLEFYLNNLDVFLKHIAIASKINSYIVDDEDQAKPKKTYNTKKNAAINNALQKDGLQTEIVPFKEKPIERTPGLFLSDGLSGSPGSYCFTKCSRIVDDNRWLIELNVPYSTNCQPVTNLPADSPRFLTYSQARIFSTNICKVVRWLKTLTLLGKSDLYIDKASPVSYIDAIKFADKRSLIQYAMGLQNAIKLSLSQ